MSRLLALSLALSFFSAGAVRAQEPQPEPVRVELEVSAEPLELRAAHEQPFSIRLINTTDEPQVVWPFFSLRVLDAAGDAVRTSSNIGRWGFLRDPCFLRNVSFITLAPGERRNVSAALGQYMQDPEAITGWELPGAGTYSLVVGYRYRRAPFVARCNQGCPGHGAEQAPWNVAVEVDQTVRGQLVVVADAPLGDDEAEILAAVETYFGTLFGQHDPETLDTVVDWDALLRAHAEIEPRLAGMTAERYRGLFMERLQKGPQLPAEAFEAMREGMVGRPEVTVNDAHATATLRGGEVLLFARGDAGWRLVGKRQTQAAAPQEPRSPGE